MSVTRENPAAHGLLDTQKTPTTARFSRSRRRNAKQSSRGDRLLAGFGVAHFPENRGDDDAAAERHSAGVCWISYGSTVAVEVAAVGGINQTLTAVCT